MLMQGSEMPFYDPLDFLFVSEQPSPKCIFTSKYTKELGKK